MTALKAPCPHGRYDEHLTEGFAHVTNCPGGSLLPPDSLVIVKEDGLWPVWAWETMRESLWRERPELTDISADDLMISTLTALDALAAAQPENKSEIAVADDAPKDS